MEKIDKLLQAVDHPERFTDSELKDLLSDPEVRDLYKALCSVRSESFISEEDLTKVDIYREWSRFKASRRKKHFITLLLQKKIAVAALVLIASCSIIMVGVSLNKGNVRKEQENSVASLVTETPHEDHTFVRIPGSRDTVIIFEDEKLNRILEVIAPYYNSEVKLKYPISREVRLFFKWDSSMKLPTVMDHLNSFDRINLFMKGDTITDY